jgi:hypothetical protein
VIPAPRQAANQNDDRRHRHDWRSLSPVGHGDFDGVAASEITPAGSPSTPGVMATIRATTLVCIRRIKDHRFSLAHQDAGASRSTGVVPHLKDTS